MAIGQDLLNVPMGEMILSMATAMAEAQRRLDEASVAVAEMMGGLQTVTNDQGQVTFTDSRVFFGHEYMTVGEAMITQGEGNPAVAALIGPVSIVYKSYTAPTSSTAVEAPGMGIPATGSGHVLTQQALIDYQKNQQGIRNRIEHYEDLLVAERAKTGSPGPDNNLITSYEGYISTLKAAETSNVNSASTVLARQIQVPTRLSLLELGFAPTFYQFVDTIIEVKISISMSQESSTETSSSSSGTSRGASIGFRFSPFGRGRGQVQTRTNISSVGVTTSSKYSYSAEGASLLRTKLVPLPPPPILEERIRAIMAADQAQKAAVLALLTGAAAA